MHKKINKLILTICMMIMFSGTVVACADASKHEEQIPKTEDDSFQQRAEILGTVTPLVETRTSVNQSESDYENLRRTPTQTPTATLPPLGIFSIQFYPPLILKYDPQVWEDKSEYYNPKQMVNYLNAKELRSCTIMPLGGSGFYPKSEPLLKQFGDLEYLVYLSDEAQSNAITYYYFVNNALKKFDHRIGIPIFVVTSSPTEWISCRPEAEEVLATLSLSQTPEVTCTPTIDYSLTAISIVGQLVSTVQPNTSELSHSPDRKWRVELVTFPCTPIKSDAPLPEEHAYDVLRIINLMDGKANQIATQLQNCGGVGAFGLGEIAWSPNSEYYYYTDAREGVPDGGFPGWMRTVYRYDIKTQGVFILGPAELSPDRKDFAAVEQFVNSEWLSSLIALVIWNTNGLELSRFETNFEPNTTDNLQASWSPTAEDLAYIETTCTQEPKCFTNLFLVNRVSGTRVGLLENHQPAFQAVSWVDPGQLNLVDMNYQVWIYTFADQNLRLR